MLKKLTRMGVTVGRGGKSVFCLEPLVSLPAADKICHSNKGRRCNTVEGSKIAPGVHFPQAVFSHLMSF